MQLAQCQFQAEHRPSRSTTTDGESSVTMEGSSLLRFEALEAKVEAQVPKSLNLESQILGLKKEELIPLWWSNLFLKTYFRPFFFLDLSILRIKALSNEVNKRFHDLESQMRKTNFDAASVFARLESVEVEPLVNKLKTGGFPVLMLFKRL